MISPRFQPELGSVVDLPQTDRSNTTIALHLHVPDRIADALMQLVVTLSQQRSLFPDFNSSLTTDHPATDHPGPIVQTAPPGGGDAARAAATRVAGSGPADPAVDTTAESPESLLQIFRIHCKEKRLRRGSPATVADHETGCRHFDEFLQETGGNFDAEHPGDASPKTLHRFATPVSCLGNPEQIRQFVDWLIVTKENASFTINRRLIALKIVAQTFKIDFERPTMDELDRRIGELRPDGQKINKSKREALATKDDGTQLPDRKIPSFAEIDAMARHVSVAKYPYGSHAPYFWRGWIRYLALIGPRSRDIVSVNGRKPGLKKSDIVWDSACPIADVNSALGKVLQSPHGWLWYDIAKHHKGTNHTRKILIPMPLWLRQWVKFFYEFSHHPIRVFPSVQKQSKSLVQSKKSFAWDSIIAAAGVDPRLVESEGKSQSIAIRKFAANWWDLNVQSAYDAKLAQKVSHYVLHHSEVTVSDKHYLSVQASVLPVMLAMLPSWTIPAADAPPVSMLPE